MDGETIVVESVNSLVMDTAPIDVINEGPRSGGGSVNSPTWARRIASPKARLSTLGEDFQQVEHSFIT